MHERSATAVKLVRVAALAAVVTSVTYIGATAGAAPTSAYSTFDWEEDCEVLDAARPDEAGSWVRLKCAGYDSYPVFVAQDDQRMSVGYGFVDPGSIHWESFQSFNHVSGTVEWRLIPVKGEMRPFATTTATLFSSKIDCEAFSRP